MHHIIIVLVTRQCINVSTINITLVFYNDMGIKYQVDIKYLSMSLNRYLPRLYASGFYFVFDNHQELVRLFTEYNELRSK